MTKVLVSAWGFQMTLGQRLVIVSRAWAGARQHRSGREDIFDDQERLVIVF